MRHVFFPELGIAGKAEWKSVVFDYILSTFYFNQIYDKIECFF
jgi:hypothetical protein